MQQMRLLGIDYGKTKIGLAISEGTLAAPFKVIRYYEEDTALKKVAQLIVVEEIGKVVVGISEGKMADASRAFGEKLKMKLKVQVVFFDETLTTHDAQQLAIAGGMKRKKRKELEDAFAATLILQSYIDSIQ